MPILKNRMFQPVGLMLRDGTMLHVPSRAEFLVQETEIDAPHVRAALACGQLAWLEQPAQPGGDAQPPGLQPEPPPEPVPRHRKARKA